MKKLYTSVLIAGFCACTSAFAQENALRAYIQSPTLPNREVHPVLLLAGNDKIMQYKTSPSAQEVSGVEIGTLKILYVMDPQDYLNAVDTYHNGKYREARGQMEKIQEKYKNIANMPDSIVARASYYILECAVRMHEWSDAAQMINAFAYEKTLNDAMRTDYGVIQLVVNAQTPAKAEDVKKQAESLLGDKNLSLLNLGRVHYALGCAKKALKAPLHEVLDHWAVAISASHGRDLELAGDATLKSIDAMLETKEVSEFVATRTAAPSPAEWKGMDVNIKEACSYAVFYRDILADGKPMPTTNPNYAKLLQLYVSPNVK